MAVFVVVSLAGFRFFVASAPVRALLLAAKLLMIAANGGWLSSCSSSGTAWPPRPRETAGAICGWAGA